MTIGERIKQRRLELDMSQEELAQKMGYSTRNAIYQFEQKDNMKLSLVSKFAKALDCTESYLMGWDEENKKKKLEKAYATGYRMSQLTKAISDELTDKDIEMIIKMMNLSPDMKNFIFNQIDYLHSQEQNH